MMFTRCMALAAAAVTSVAMAAPVDAKFDSYTKAYKQAGEQSRPMLVILNPGKGETGRLDVESMSIDTATADYVVAEIDTTTAHGKKVHELFKSPSLPHVVIIDDQQKKQIYKTSRSLSESELVEVLANYRDGAPTTVTAAKPIINGAISSPSYSSPTIGVQGSPVYNTPIYSSPLSIQSYPADCPSCRRNAGYRF